VICSKRNQRIDVRMAIGTDKTSTLSNQFHSTNHLTQLLGFRFSIILQSAWWHQLHNSSLETLKALLVNVKYENVYGAWFIQFLRKPLKHTYYFVTIALHLLRSCLVLFYGHVTLFRQSQDDLQRSAIVSSYDMTGPVSTRKSKYPRSMKSIRDIK